MVVASLPRCRVTALVKADPVDSRPAEHGVRTGAADDAIGAIPAEEGIPAVPALQDVSATATQHAIRTTEPADRLGRVGPDEEVSAVRADDVAVGGSADRPRVQAQRHDQQRCPR